MIGGYLDGRQLAYRRDSSGDFQVDFAHDDELGCATTFLFMAVGQNDEIFGIEARSNRRFSEDAWDWAMFLVNEWNKRMRYPKAYFMLSDRDQSRTGEIRLEQYLDLERAIHQDLFDSIVFTTMGAATRFWSWVNEQPLQRQTRPIG